MVSKVWIKGSNHENNLTPQSDQTLQSLVYGTTNKDIYQIWDKYDNTKYENAISIAR